MVNKKSFLKSSIFYKQIKKVKEIASWFYKSLLKNKRMISSDSREIIPNLYKVFMKDIRFVVSYNHEIRNAIKIVTVDGLEYYKIMSLDNFLKRADGVFVRNSKFKISRRYRQTFIEQLEKYYS